VEALGINLPGLVAQIVNFALLLFLLWRFALPPLLRLLDERAQRVRESMERALASPEMKALHADGALFIGSNKTFVVEEKVII